jgi:hypothetical protein
MNIRPMPHLAMTRAQALLTIADADSAATKPVWYRELAWLTARGTYPAAPPTSHPRAGGDPSGTGGHAA